MADYERQLKQGTIGWAEVPDPQGDIKQRPVVIVTESDEIVLDEPILAVAVTTTFPNPPTREYVELPWFRLGHPATNLSKRSAAVCNWLVSLRPSDLISVRGYVPTKYLREIIIKVRALNS